MGSISFDVDAASFTSTFLELDELSDSSDGVPECAASLVAHIWCALGHLHTRAVHVDRQCSCILAPDHLRIDRMLVDIG